MAIFKSLMRRSFLNPIVNHLKTLNLSNQAKTTTKNLHRNGVIFQSTSYSRFCTCTGLSIEIEEFVPHGDLSSPFCSALIESWSRFNVPSMEDKFESPLVFGETRFCLLSSLLPEFHGVSGKFLARIGFIGTPGPNTWNLFNPLSMHEYMFITPSVIGSMKLLDCRALMLSSVFTLILYDEQPKPISKKVVGGWNFDSTYSFAALVQIHKDFGGGLMLWRLDDEQWSKIECDENGNSLRVVDIAHYNGKFYVFDLSKWRIGVIDPEISSTEMEFMDAPDILGEPLDNKFTLNIDGSVRFLSGIYMVPSNEGLYVVIYTAERKPTMVVFLMNEDDETKQKWERKKSLGDQIFFIGDDVSFSLPSSSENLPEWKSNSMCFFTKPYPLFFDGCSSSDFSRKLPKGAECLKYITYAQYHRYFTLFDMDEQGKGFVPFDELPRDVYTGLFFPPPPWIKCHCPTLGNVEVKLDGLKFSLDEPCQ